jgi:hypothetical protein
VKASKGIIVGMLTVSILTIVFLPLLLDTKTVYAQQRTPKMFADPSAFHGEESLHIGDKFNFTIKLQNWTDIQVIAVSLHFNPVYVNVTNIIPDPYDMLSGEGFVIGDWFPKTGYITDITLYTTGTWNIITPVALWLVEVQIMNLTPSSGTILDLYGMDCYDAYLNNFLSGDCPYDLTFYYPYETISHAVTADTQTFTVQTRSNSKVTNIQFSQAEKSIIFNVTGTTGTSGWVNVTIPKVLLDGPWTIFIDNNDVTQTATITANQTHTFIYVTYTHSTHKITITGTNVIPEYTPLIMLTTLITITATTILATSRRKLYILKRKR